MNAPTVDRTAERVRRFLDWYVSEESVGTVVDQYSLGQKSLAAAVLRLLEEDK